VFGLIFLAATSTKSTNPFSPLILIALLGVVFYMLLIRPQRRQQQQQKDLANNLDPGHEVVTHGGIFGTVVEVDDDEGTILLEVTTGNEIRMLKQAVARRLNDVQGADDDDDDESDADSSDDDHKALGDGAKTPGEKEADEQR